MGYQHLVVANGRTAFLFLLVPDKSTAYAPWLTSQNWMVDSTRGTRVPGVATPPLTAVLRRAISLGTRDVYLPDDTHWGSEGSRLTARLVAGYVGASTD